MVKNVFLITTLILTTGIFCYYSSCCKPTSGSLLESDALYKIFDLTNVPYERNLTSLNAAAQKHFIRKAGIERWEMDAKFEEIRPELLSLFKEIGLVEQRMPQAQSYDYALFMGALAERMEKRKQFLEFLIHNGITFKAVIVMVGQRPLDVTQEAEYLSYAKTEADVAEHLFKDFTIPCIMVKTPMLKDQQGTVRRPTTADTFETWLVTNPQPGSALVISDNPFTQRQTNVAAALLPKSFIVEGAGAAANEDTSIAVYLDELARTIYSMVTPGK